jgi:hypothetical protein
MTTPVKAMFIWPENIETDSILSMMSLLGQRNRLTQPKPSFFGILMLQYGTWCRPDSAHTTQARYFPVLPTACRSSSPALFDPVQPATCLHSRRCESLSKRPPSSRVRDKGISPPPTSSPMRMQQSATVTSYLPEPSASPPSLVKMACRLQTRLTANQRTKSTKWTPTSPMAPKPTASL